MENACCVAARDKMVVPNQSAGENFQRSNVRHSPTWSFWWDNRGHVVGEETSFSWLPNGISQNDGSEIKCDPAFVSSEGSLLDSFRTQELHKSPALNLSFQRNSSMDTIFKQKENNSSESVAPSYPSPTPLSLLLDSEPSSFPTSQLSFQSYFHHASSSTLKLTQHPHLSKQVSDGQNWGLNSQSRSLAAKERLETSLRCDPSQCGPYEPLSHGNDCFGLQCDKTDHNGNRISNHKQQTCGACSRHLSDKSLLRSQNIYMTNELSVSAILAFGHVYHGECLEEMTPEIDKFDPSCPICKMGEKKTAKLSKKTLKVEMYLKDRHNKRLRNRALDNDFDSDDFVMFDHSHIIAVAGKSPKLVSSSSAKSYSTKHFLDRHLSFGSRGKSPKENLPVKKKGFFWTTSSNI